MTICTDGLTSALAHHCVEYLKAELHNNATAEQLHNGQCDKRELIKANRAQDEARATLVGYAQHLARG